MQSHLAKYDPSRPPLRWLLRLPTLLYGARLGWLLGERFALITVPGRKTGLPRRVVLEVVGREPSTGAFVVASAWGRGAQWFRNLEAHPRARVQLGWRRFEGAVSVLGEREAAAELRCYARAHPWAYRYFIGPLLLGRRPTGAEEEFGELARAVPVLRFRAAT